MTRRDVTFESGGVQCAGWLYLPAGADRGLPCVVMAHGTTGTMTFGLDRYARRFAAAGLVVLAFDYRHFGRSGGQPRQVISIRRQLQDWRSAIRFARHLSEVDTGRIALWGTSLSAGHVVTIAASDPAVAAVIAQLPWMGSDVRAKSPRPARVTRGLFMAALRDVIGSALGRPPVIVPMVGEPGSVSVFSGEDVQVAVRSLAENAPDWRNELVARSLFALIRYRPGAVAGEVAKPLLVCVADADTAVSPRLARRAAEQAPRGELRRYPGGHFNAYLGEVSERMIVDEIDFLNRHLTAVTDRPPGVSAPDGVRRR